MTSLSFMRFGAVAAGVGGALRIASAFIGYEDGLVWLETLYAIIDLGILFGLMAVYLFVAEKVGRLGLISFLIAVTGAASILGPDSVKWDLNFYQIGAFILTVGTIGLSVCLLRARILVVGAIFWVFGSAAGVAAGLTNSPTGLWVAGILWGVGFIAAGVGVYGGALDRQTSFSRWHIPPAASQ